ncbi:hypothetical protein ACHAWU_004564 [Discostella pseudostelligera]|uniref:Uncharacterized protein n=1 Tax=Discostella pseudostelligera TaxID=259834 RepID=A0ABD3MW74_9STRA
MQAIPCRPRLADATNRTTFPPLPTTSVIFEYAIDADSLVSLPLNLRSLGAKVGCSTPCLPLFHAAITARYPLSYTFVNDSRQRPSPLILKMKKPFFEPSCNVGLPCSSTGYLGKHLNLSLVAATNCFSVETNFIADIGPNCDGFGGVRIFCFHFFRVSVPTKKFSSKSLIDVLSRSHEIT